MQHALLGLVFSAIFVAVAKIDAASEMVVAIRYLGASMYRPDKTTAVIVIRQNAD